MPLFGKKNKRFKALKSHVPGWIQRITELMKSKLDVSYVSVYNVYHPYIVEIEKLIQPLFKETLANDEQAKLLLDKIKKNLFYIFKLLNALEPRNFSKLKTDDIKTIEKEICYRCYALAANLSALISQPETKEENKEKLLSAPENPALVLLKNITASFLLHFKRINEVAPAKQRMEDYVSNCENFEDKFTVELLAKAVIDSQKEAKEEAEMKNGNGKNPKNKKKTKGDIFDNSFSVENSRRASDPTGTIRSKETEESKKGVSFSASTPINGASSNDDNNSPSRGKSKTVLGNSLPTFKVSSNGTSHAPEPTQDSLPQMEWLDQIPKEPNIERIFEGTGDVEHLVEIFNSIANNLAKSDDTDKTPLYQRAGGNNIQKHFLHLLSYIDQNAPAFYLEIIQHLNTCFAGEMEDPIVPLNRAGQAIKRALVTTAYKDNAMIKSLNEAIDNLSAQLPEEKEEEKLKPQDPKIPESNDDHYVSLPKHLKESKENKSPVSASESAKPIEEYDSAVYRLKYELLLNTIKAVYAEGFSLTDISEIDYEKLSNTSIVLFGTIFALINTFSSSFKTQTKEALSILPPLPSSTSHMSVKDFYYKIDNTKQTKRTEVSKAAALILTENKKDEGNYLAGSKYRLFITGHQQAHETKNKKNKEDLTTSLKNDKPIIEKLLENNYQRLITNFNNLLTSIANDQKTSPSEPLSSLINLENFKLLFNDNFVLGLLQNSSTNEQLNEINDKHLLIYQGIAGVENLPLSFSKEENIHTALERFFEILQIVALSRDNNSKSIIEQQIEKNLADIKEAVKAQQPKPTHQRRGSDPTPTGTLKRDIAKQLRKSRSKSLLGKLASSLPIFNKSEKTNDDKPKVEQPKPPVIPVPVAKENHVPSYAPKRVVDYLLNPTDLNSKEIKLKQLQEDEDWEDIEIDVIWEYFVENYGIKNFRNIPSTNNFKEVTEFLEQEKQERGASPSSKLLTFKVNLGNFHWTILFFDPNTETYRYVDPLGSPSPTQLALLEERIKQVYKNAKNSSAEIVRLQNQIREDKGVHVCGPCIALIAEYILENGLNANVAELLEMFDKSYANLYLYARKYFVEEIIAKKIDKDKKQPRVDQQTFGGYVAEKIAEDDAKKVALRQARKNFGGLLRKINETYKLVTEMELAFIKVFNKLPYEHRVRIYENDPGVVHSSPLPIFCDNAKRYIKTYTDQDLDVVTGALDIDGVNALINATYDVLATNDAEHDSTEEESDEKEDPDNNNESLKEEEGEENKPKDPPKTSADPHLKNLLETLRELKKLVPSKPLTSASLAYTKLQECIFTIYTTKYNTEKNKQLLDQYSDLKIKSIKMSMSSDVTCDLISDLVWDIDTSFESSTEFQNLATVLITRDDNYLKRDRNLADSEDREAVQDGLSKLSATNPQIKNIPQFRMLEHMIASAKTVADEIKTSEENVVPVEKLPHLFGAKKLSEKDFLTVLDCVNQIERANQTFLYYQERGQDVAFFEAKFLTEIKGNFSKINEILIANKHNPLNIPFKETNIKAFQKSIKNLTKLRKDKKLDESSLKNYFDKKLELLSKLKENAQKLLILLIAYDEAARVNPQLKMYQQELRNNCFTLITSWLDEAEKVDIAAKYLANKDQKSTLEKLAPYQNLNGVLQLLIKQYVAGDEFNQVFAREKEYVKSYEQDCEELQAKMKALPSVPTKETLKELNKAAITLTVQSGLMADNFFKKFKFAFLEHDSKKSRPQLVHKDTYRKLKDFKSSSKNGKDIDSNSSPQDLIIGCHAYLLQVAGQADKIANEIQKKLSAYGSNEITEEKLSEFSPLLDDFDNRILEFNKNADQFIDNVLFSNARFINPTIQAVQAINDFCTAFDRIYEIYKDYKNADTTLLNNKAVSSFFDKYKNIIEKIDIDTLKKLPYEITKLKNIASASCENIVELGPSRDNLALVVNYVSAFWQNHDLSDEHCLTYGYVALNFIDDLLDLINNSQFSDVDSIRNKYVELFGPLYQSMEDDISSNDVPVVDALAFLKDRIYRMFVVPAKQSLKDKLHAPVIATKKEPEPAPAPNPPDPEPTGSGSKPTASGSDPNTPPNRLPPSLPPRGELKVEVKVTIQPGEPEPKETLKEKGSVSEIPNTAEEQKNASRRKATSTEIPPPPAPAPVTHSAPVTAPFPAITTEMEAARIAAKEWLKGKEVQKISLDLYLGQRRRSKGHAGTIMIIGTLLGGGLTACGIVLPPLYALGVITFIGFGIAAAISSYNANKKFKAGAQKAYEQSFGSLELLYMLSRRNERSYTDDKDLPPDKDIVIDQTTAWVEKKGVRIPLDQQALAILSNLLRDGNKRDAANRHLVIETILLRYTGCEQWKFYEINDQRTAYLPEKVRPAISANPEAADQLVDALVNGTIESGQPGRLVECLNYLIEKIAKTKADKIPPAVYALATRLNSTLNTNPDFAKTVFTAMGENNHKRFLTLIGSGSKVEQLAKDGKYKEIASGMTPTSRKNPQPRISVEEVVAAAKPQSNLYILEELTKQSGKESTKKIAEFLKGIRDNGQSLVIDNVNLAASLLARVFNDNNPHPDLCPWLMQTFLNEKAFDLATAIEILFNPKNPIDYSKKIQIITEYFAALKTRPDLTVADKVKRQIIFLILGSMDIKKKTIKDLESTFNLLRTCSKFSAKAENEPVSIANIVTTLASDNADNRWLMTNYIGKIVYQLCAINLNTNPHQPLQKAFAKDLLNSGATNPQLEKASFGLVAAMYEDTSKDAKTARANLIAEYFQQTKSDEDLSNHAINFYKKILETDATLMSDAAKITATTEVLIQFIDRLNFKPEKLGLVTNFISKFIEETLKAKKIKKDEPDPEAKKYQTKDKLIDTLLSIIVTNDAIRNDFIPNDHVTAEIFPQERSRLSRAIKDATKLQSKANSRDMRPTKSPSTHPLEPVHEDPQPTPPPSPAFSGGSEKKSDSDSQASLASRIGLFASDSADKVGTFFRKFRHSGTAEERKGLLSTGKNLLKEEEEESHDNSSKSPEPPSSPTVDKKAKRASSNTINFNETQQKLFEEADRLAKEDGAALSEETKKAQEKVDEATQVLGDFLDFLGPKQ